MIPATGVQPHSTGTNYPAVVIVYGDQTATVTIAGVESEHFPVVYADTVAAFAKAFYVHAPAGHRTQGAYRAAMARGIRAAAAGPDDVAVELAGMVRGLKSLSGLSKRLADVREAPNPATASLDADTWTCDCGCINDDGVNTCEQCGASADGVLAAGEK